MRLADALLAVDVDPTARPFVAAVRDRLRAVLDGHVVTPDDAWLARLLVSNPVPRADVETVVRALAGGALADERMGALLVALGPDAVSGDGLAGAARVMREHARAVAVTRTPGDVLIDTCGTGGDTLGTYNVSTTIAFILAAAGLRVAKHGNAAQTSRCGSADVLRALGVKVELEPDAVARCIRDTGVGFMFAPLFHQAFKNVVRIRRQLAAEMPPTLRPQTIFNVLGPLANPAGADTQVVGVYAPTLLGKFADALRALGTRRALVVFGVCDGRDVGLDEVSTAGATHVAELAADGAVRTYIVTPEELGLARTDDVRAYAGGDAAENAALLRAVLGGREEGPRLDLALANAAAGLYVGGKAASIADGVDLARALVASGEPLRRLDAFRAATQAV